MTKIKRYQILIQHITQWGEGLLMRNKDLTRKVLRKYSSNSNHFFLTATSRFVLEYLFHASGMERTTHTPEQHLLPQYILMDYSRSSWFTTITTSTSSTIASSFSYYLHVGNPCPFHVHVEALCHTQATMDVRWRTKTWRYLWYVCSSSLCLNLCGYPQLLGCHQWYWRHKEEWRLLLMTYPI